MFFKKIFARICAGALSGTLVFCMNPSDMGVQKTQVNVQAQHLDANGGSAVNAGTTSTVKKIKKKTQTGIDVSYRNSTAERYSHIDEKLVMAYPIYTIEYEDGTTEKDKVDKNERIDASDLDIDEYIFFDKGDKTFNAKQLSTGFKDSFVITAAYAQKKELNKLSVTYLGEGVKVGDKVPIYDIDLIPEYKVTYDNGEIAYENDYTVSCYDYSYSPKIIEKAGKNEITIEYTQEEDSEAVKTMTTKVTLDAKGGNSDASGEKKNDDEKGGESEEVSDTEEGTCSMPVYVSTRNHSFKVNVIDVFLDAQGDLMERRLRESFEAEEGTKVEREAFELENYYNVSDIKYLVTITEDTDITFYYQLSEDADPNDKPKKDDDKKKDNGDDGKKTEDSGNQDDGGNGDNGGNTDDGTGNSDDLGGSDAGKDNKNPSKKKDSKKAVRDFGSNAESSDNADAGDELTYKKYSQEAHTDEATEEVSYKKRPERASVFETSYGGGDVSDPGRIIRRMTTGIVSSILAVGLVTTGAFKYLWMLIFMLFTKKKRLKWHGIVLSGKNRFVEVRNEAADRKTYQGYINEFKNIDLIHEEILKSKVYTLFPANTKMTIKCDLEEITVRADEENLFDLLGKLPEGVGEVSVRIFNNMAMFDTTLKFEI